MAQFPISGRLVLLACFCVTLASVNGDVAPLETFAADGASALASVDEVGAQEGPRMHGNRPVTQQGDGGHEKPTGNASPFEGPTLAEAGKPVVGEAAATTCRDTRRSCPAWKRRGYCESDSRAEARPRHYRKAVHHVV